MEFNWEDFKKAYKNETEARQGFVNLCDLLMQKLYPDYTIKNSDDIKESENKTDAALGKKCIVYLPKYFLDGVSNSRKGQIRKALNDNLPYMKANKISQWVLLMPLRFLPEEKSWWENWSLRIKQENGITPSVKLADELTALITKFEIGFQGLETLKKPEPQPVADDDVMDFDFGYDPSTDEGEPEAAEPQKEETPAPEPQPQPEPEQEIKSEPEQEQEQEPESEPEPVSKKAVPEPVLEELSSTHDFKTKFEALEARKLELPSAQREIFDDRREKSSVKNYLNDFVFGDLSQFLGKDLIRKAQIYVNNEQFSRGLYIYEYADKKGLVQDVLLNDYKKGVNESTFNLNYKYYMIKGDLLFSEGDYINAAETYGKACEVIDTYKEILETDLLVTTTFTSLMRGEEAIMKYYEAYGEAFLSAGEYEKASEQFKLAYDHSDSDKTLRDRAALAEYLEKGTNRFKSPWLAWLNIFVAPYYYFKARKIDKETADKKLRRRAVWGIVLTVLFVAAVFFAVRYVCLNSGSDGNGKSLKADVSMTPLALQLSRGDYYMDRISPETPHYIDSAITAYQRALRIDNTDTAAETGYQKACVERANYLNQVQRNIRVDSASYFLSMRRPTEGLRLFKYIYDPSDRSKGKFGFVDTLGNVIIAPMFDFNYGRMNENGETFYNGRAKVCLKVAEYDTVYFYIDQRGNEIKE